MKYAHTNIVEFMVLAEIVDAQDANE